MGLKIFLHPLRGFERNETGLQAFRRVFAQWIMDEWIITPVPVWIWERHGCVEGPNSGYMSNNDRTSNRSTTITYTDKQSVVI